MGDLLDETFNNAQKLIMILDTFLDAITRTWYESRVSHKKSGISELIAALCKKEMDLIDKTTPEFSDLVEIKNKVDSMIQNGDNLKDLQELKVIVDKSLENIAGRTETVIDLKAKNDYSVTDRLEGFPTSASPKLLRYVTDQITVDEFYAKIKTDGKYYKNSKNIDATEIKLDNGKIATAVCFLSGDSARIVGKALLGVAADKQYLSRISADYLMSKGVNTKDAAGDQNRFYVVNNVSGFDIAAIEKIASSSGSRFQFSVSPNEKGKFDVACLNSDKKLLKYALGISALSDVYPNKAVEDKKLAKSVIDSAYEKAQRECDFVINSATNPHDWIRVQNKNGSLSLAVYNDGVQTAAFMQPLVDKNTVREELYFNMSKLDHPVQLDSRPSMSEIKNDSEILSAFDTVLTDAAENVYGNEFVDNDLWDFVDIMGPDSGIEGIRNAVEKYNMDNVGTFRKISEDEKSKLMGTLNNIDRGGSDVRTLLDEHSSFSKDITLEAALGLTDTSEEKTPGKEEIARDAKVKGDDLE